MHDHHEVLARAAEPLAARRLIDDVRRQGPRTAARVRRVLDHELFFEHPVDHLPGMYLLEATRQLAGEAELGAAWWPRTGEVEFARYAELAGEVELEACAARLQDGAVALEVRATQGGELVARGRGEWVDAPLPAPGRGTGDPGLPAGAEPVPPALVHMRRAENVALAWTARRGEGYLAGLRAEHPFFEPRRAGFVSHLHLVEGVRQLAEALTHRYLGAPEGDVFVVEALRLLGSRPGRLGAPVLIAAEPSELVLRGGALRRAACRFVATQEGAPVFRAEARWRVIPGAIYRRARGTTQGAGQGAAQATKQGAGRGAA
ncbi:MAG: AfsA-related hotdog domain-containing protein [Planctomycetota bacterium]